MRLADKKAGDQVSKQAVDNRLAGIQVSKQSGNQASSQATNREIPGKLIGKQAGRGRARKLAGIQENIASRYQGSRQASRQSGYIRSLAGMNINVRYVYSYE